MFKIYFCETSPRFLPIGTKPLQKCFSGKVNMNNYQKKVFKFHLRFAKGRKNVRKGGAQFHLNSYNS